MPELPEVETVCRGLEKAMLGIRIAEVDVRRSDLRFPVAADFPAVAAGQCVASFRRRGKYIVMEFAGRQAAVLHLGMSGRIRIYAPGQDCELQKHDHVVFYLANGSCVVFNDARRFGFLRLFEPDQWEHEEPFVSMGPEPLSNGFNADILAQRLAGRQGPIKVVLLDQKVVAGLGNIYVCEALYMSGIDPRRSAGGLTMDEVSALTQAIREVLERAIEAGGSTLRDYQKTDGSLGYFQYMFSVYDRAGKACPACDCDVGVSGGVQRIVQGGRSTFYCARQQK